MPLIKGAIAHKGFGLLDIISPCVTFNDNEESTKSYSHVRKFYHQVVDTDFVPPAEEIKAAYDEGEAMPISLHDGSQIVFRKVDKNYDPTSRQPPILFLGKVKPNKSSLPVFYTLIKKQMTCMKVRIQQNNHYLK